MPDPSSPFTAAAPAAPTVPVAPVVPAIIDLDAGQGFGRDTVELLRPFKFKGTSYTSISFRVPTGFDLKKHTNARTGIDDYALMGDLAEISTDVFDAMYAGDRNRIDLAVGKHLAGIPATSTTSSPRSGSATPGAIAT